MDWGVHAYDPTGANGVDPRNGGIVGTVSYDTTRNELDPQYAADRGLAAGHLRTSRSSCTRPSRARHDTPARPATPTDRYELDADGSYAKGKLLNTYVSEHWSRPTGCTARDVDGNPLVHGVDENVLVPNQETDGECISSFMQGIQFGPYADRPGHPGRQLRRGGDGNYGFGDGCFTGTLGRHRPGEPGLHRRDVRRRCRRGDYLVHVDDPGRRHRQPDVQGDRRRGHQHRQRRPDRPAGAAAGVRRRAAHRRPRTATATDGYPAERRRRREPTTCPSA